MTRPTPEEVALVAQLRLVWDRIDEEHPPLALTGDNGVGRFYREHILVLDLGDADLRKKAFGKMAAFGINGAAIHKVLKPVGGAFWRFRTAPRLEAKLTNGGFSFLLSDEEGRIVAQAELDRFDRAEQAFLTRSTT